MQPFQALIAIALAGFVSASPVQGSAGDNKAAGCPYAAQAANAKREYTTNSSATFDPVKQKIDVTGQYAFQPPTATDKRGPCPALNALANHGYLPHNGVTNFSQAAYAVNKVFGMGVDVSGLLSTLGTLLNGNPKTTEWDIHLSGAHNLYEADASPTYWDGYLNNDDPNTLNIKFFKQLYDRLPESDPNANFDYDVIVEHRAMRYNTSVSENPYFYYSPFGGPGASASAHAFLGRLMANHSAEAPNGILNHQTLKSLFAVSGDSANLTYTYGHERIPDNYYRRPDDYNFPALGNDIRNAGEKHPKLLLVGGNTGTVNSFKSINITDLTGGAYFATTPPETNNLLCFAFRMAQEEILNSTRHDLEYLTAGIDLWNKQVAPSFADLNCSTVSHYDTSLLEVFPGSKYFY
ncbi:hypothetical protein RSOLAG22IIIB_10762 [Rhizoctonia solani]|uniref:Heme haloperoxidase family profile domain-containing protein n=1 Tax=Rhizoctonia solani TaxID=456999 RepID=A0A0K6G4F2_9AGAM|nr:hypothetical protein RSOLAG22IIIB_10762 [Rhizoctonia solani]